MLAELARGRPRAKLPELRRALEGRIQPHHRTVIARILAHIDVLEESMAQVQDAIGHTLTPFAAAVQMLQTIPGVGATAAATIAGEIGTDAGAVPPRQAPRLVGRSLPRQQAERGQAPQRQEERETGIRWGIICHGGWGGKRRHRTVIASALQGGGDDRGPSWLRRHDLGP